MLQKKGKQNVLWTPNRGRGLKLSFTSTKLLGVTKLMLRSQDGHGRRLALEVNTKDSATIILQKALNNWMKQEKVFARFKPT